MKATSALLFLSGALFAGALFAGDGVVLAQQVENIAEGTAFETTIYVEPNRVAMDTVAEGREMGFIYLADEQVVRMVDHGRQTYTEMTQADFDRIQSQIQKLQEQLANMPPQQRKMMEKMMQGKLGGALGAEPVEPVKYRRGDGETSINGFDCAWYDGFRGDKLEAQMCAIDFADVDLRAEDLAIFGRMAEFLTQLAPQMQDRFSLWSGTLENEETLPGVPAEQTSYESGKPATRSTLKRLERATIDEARYAPPEGYKRQAMMGR